MAEWLRQGTVRATCIWFLSRPIQFTVVVRKGIWPMAIIAAMLLKVPPCRLAYWSAHGLGCIVINSHYLLFICVKITPLFSLCIFFYYVHLFILHWLLTSFCAYLQIYTVLSGVSSWISADLPDALPVCLLYAVTCACVQLWVWVMHSGCSEKWGK